MISEKKWVNRLFISSDEVEKVALSLRRVDVKPWWARLFGVIPETASENVRL